MDEKHRQYCIQLGNPFMGENNYKKQNQYNRVDNMWNEDYRMQDDNWLKNTKKYTN